MKDYLRVLQNYFDSSNILLNEPMAKHTSFKVGGPCSALVLPKTENDIIFTIKTCSEYNVPYFVMGNGSNLLVLDGGYNGVIIKITHLFSNVQLQHTKLNAQSGISLSGLANFALRNELTGLEFASGIPGTLGGAVYMNAGAYGEEMKDIIESARILMENGEIIELSNSELEFGYRTSKLTNYNSVVLSAVCVLKQGDPVAIKNKMDHLNAQRKEKQPLELPNAGSTFKRPIGSYAGKLIMDSDLRGFTIGGAAVSSKHCGFIVNIGNAKASHIISLIDHIQKTVLLKQNVNLELELRIIGDNSN